MHGLAIPAQLQLLCTNHITLTKGKNRYENHHEKQHVSAHGGSTLDGGARRPGGGRRARTFSRYATGPGVDRPGSAAGDNFGRWDRRGKRHPTWSIYADLEVYGEPR